MSDKISGEFPMAHGELTAPGTSSAAIAVAGTYYLVATGGTTTLTMGVNFDTTANGRLRYIGTKTLMFHCGASLSFHYSAVATQLLSVRAAKNGTTIAASQLDRSITSAAVDSTAMHFMTTLATNDYLEIYATDDSGTNKTVIFDQINIFAVAIPS